MIALNAKSKVVSGYLLGYVNENSKPLSFFNKDIDQGLEISEWPKFIKTDKNIPVRTSGMMNCTAVIIRHPKFHYMLHLNPIWNCNDDIYEHIVEALDELVTDYEDVKINIILGTCYGTLKTTKVFLEELFKFNSRLRDKVAFSHFPKKATMFKPNGELDNILSVVSYNNRIYYMPKTKAKKKFKEGGKVIHPSLHLMNE